MSGLLLPVSCDLCGSNVSAKRYALLQSAIVTCSECGFSFVSPRMDSGILLEKLQKWANEDVLDPERLRIAFEDNTLDLFDRFLQRIEKFHIAPSRKLLDIGCGTGGFLSVAKKRNWSAEGLELGKASAGYANETLKIKVFNESLYTFAGSKDGYDVISLIEVIEHLERPREALQRIQEWLKPGGLLFITTPNFDSLYRRLFGAKWWVVNCEDEHISLFNAQTLKNVLNKQKFEVLQTHIRGMDFSGMLRLLLSKNSSGSTPSDGAGYYEARTTKTRIKQFLAKIGILGLTRSALRLLDYFFSLPFSPVYAWGEQLILVARKKNDIP